MTDSNSNPGNPFSFMVTLLFALISYVSIMLMSSCKSSKTHCDAYGDLKRQHDAYHGKEVTVVKEVTK